jgi:hypothetical protein
LVASHRPEARPVISTAWASVTLFLQKVIMLDRIYSQRLPRQTGLPAQRLRITAFLVALPGGQCFKGAARQDSHGYPD